MARRSSQVVRSTLSPEAIAPSLRRYDLPEPVTCEFWSGGMNDTYRVHSGDSSFFFRVYRRGWRTTPEVMAEVEMLEYLNRKGISVSYPIRRADGKAINHISAPEGRRQGVLFATAQGERPARSEAVSRKVGHLLAETHVCLDHFARDGRRAAIDRQQLVVEPLRAAATIYGHRQADLEWLNQVGSALHDRIDALGLCSTPAFGACHGDLHLGNVHMDSRGQLTLFDFDCFGYAPRAYDISLYLVYLQDELGTDLTGSAKRAQTRLWNAFLKGYRQERDPAPAEMEAVYLYTALRHLWLLGLHTSGASFWGRGFLDEAYFDFRVQMIRSCIRTYKLP